MTRDQVELFETFVREELMDGALPFAWVHPRTQAPAMLRLTAPYVLAPQARRELAHREARLAGVFGPQGCPGPEQRPDHPLEPGLTGHQLQSLAEPGRVVISEATRRRLVGSLFELADLGPQNLKGFAEPVRAWRGEFSMSIWGSERDSNSHRNRGLAMT